MKVTICVGSTCHLLGSRTVVERFKALVDENNLADKVELCALPAAIRNAYRRVIGKCRPREDGE